MFFPLAIDVFIVFSNSSTTFVIDVLTLCGQQKAKKAVFYWYYECQWHYREHMLPPS